MLEKKALNFNFYQSANETDCNIIEQNFIVRTKDFQLILSDLINDKMEGSVQHFLILGRRGSGKSTLLKRLECEVINNDFLKNKFVVINLAEEQSGIHRLFDLWEEVIKVLKDYGYENLPDTDDFDIPEDYGEYSRELFSKIQNAIRVKNKKILLLIDNIDKVFTGFKDDAKILRETLLKFDDVKIIGASTRMSEHFWQYDMPFYQFFRVIRLETLSKTDIEKLLMHWAKLLKEKEIENFIKNNQGQLETIRILTDGLPRTLQFFIDLLINRPQQNGYSYIKKIMDRMTPLYQERLGSLPAIEQKIVTKLAFFWEAVSIKELVKPTKIESKLLSANLKKLSDIGIVEKIKTGKKNHLYRLSERFFNMWIIVTQGNPVDKRNAKWLTVFLENWYNKDDIKNLISNHLKDLKEGTKNADHLSLLTKSLAQSKFASFKERDLLIDETLKLSSLNPQLKETLPEKYSDISKKIKKLITKKNYDDAFYYANQIPNEIDGVKERDLAYICDLKRDYKRAENFYLKAIKKGNIDALNNLAVLYYDQNKLDLAEEYCKKAAEKGHIKALNNLANIYLLKKDFISAEKYYKETIKKGNISALNNIGILYYNQKKLDLAESFFKKAVEKGDADAAYNLANLYKSKNDFKSAEKYYKEAIKNGIEDAFFNLAFLYETQGKIHLAEKIYKDIDAFNNLANLYKKQNKLDLAEKYYKKAVKQQNNEALHNLILLYYIRASNKKEVQELIKNLIIIDDKTKALSIIIRLWLGKPEGIYKDAMELAEKINVADEDFILHLLIHGQTNLVWQIFNNKKTGLILKEKFKPLYFATSIMLNNEESIKNKLKIPPEIKNTVYDIINTIKELKKHYYK
ncbi:MAG: tetratricopeptide repeat protein [Chlorobi bacterium]|nr:tetratricopeptide repeat protein [Chlorobiota bacterium]